MSLQEYHLLLKLSDTISAALDQQPEFCLRLLRDLRVIPRLRYMQEHDCPVSQGEIFIAIEGCQRMLRQAIARASSEVRFTRESAPIVIDLTGRFQSPASGGIE